MSGSPSWKFICVRWEDDLPDYEELRDDEPTISDRLAVVQLVPRPEPVLGRVVVGLALAVLAVVRDAVDERAEVVQLPRLHVVDGAERVPDERVNHDRQGASRGRDPNVRVAGDSRPTLVAL